jgi:hypothetical protein
MFWFCYIGQYDNSFLSCEATSSLINAEVSEIVPEHKFDAERWQIRASVKEMIKQKDTYSDDSDHSIRKNDVSSGNYKC